MTNENTPQTPDNADVELPEEFFEEESASDYHRLAAQHFADAARHHLLAALADDEGDDETNARHAYLAYRHQLNGVQCAEIAAMDNDNLDDEFDDETEAEADNS
jgi:hypothetical protein